MTNKTDETMTFKSRGVSGLGEILLGSIEVQSKIQEIVDTYEGALVAKDKRIAELEKTIKSLTDGVTHFHKSNGDMNPLLTAYIQAKGGSK